MFLKFKTATATDFTFGTQPSVHTTPKQKKGANQLTYIRAVAVLAVILLHSSGELLFDFNSHKQINTGFITSVSFYSFLRWATPFFILISGALMLAPRKWEEDKWTFLQKRVTRVLQPFFFWALIYFAYENRNYFLEGKLPHTQLFINRLFFEDGYYHLWFIPMITGLYLLTPFIRVFLKNARKSDIEYFLCLVGIVCVLQNFFPTFLVIKHMAWLGFMGWYILGHYLTNYALSAHFRKWIYTAGILAIPIQAVATLLLSNTNQFYYERFFTYISPTVIALTVAFFTYLQNVDWYDWSKRFPTLNGIALKINELSFGIYFIHALILDLLKNGYLFNLQISPSSFFNASIPPYFGIV
jgi:surface polysaccharide O-acyltransferase-like enzyme